MANNSEYLAAQAAVTIDSSFTQKVGTGRYWIDPTNISTVVEAHCPAALVASYCVLRAEPQEDGSIIVGYVGADRRLGFSKVEPEDVSGLMVGITHRKVFSDSQPGLCIEIPFIELRDGLAALAIEHNDDGSLCVGSITQPNVLVRSVGGSKDNPAYHLEGSVLKLYRPANRTSLLEKIEAESGDIVGEVAEVMSLGPLATTQTNFGTVITEGNHGDGFLPVEDKPGRNGRPLRNQFAGEIPVAARN